MGWYEWTDIVLEVSLIVLLLIRILSDKDEK